MCPLPGDITRNCCLKEHVYNSKPPMILTLNAKKKICLSLASFLTGDFPDRSALYPTTNTNRSGNAAHWLVCEDQNPGVWTSF